MSVALAEDYEQITRTTLSDYLLQHAALQPQAQALAVLNERIQVMESLTYGELAQRVESLASCLSASLDPGDRAILLYSEGLHFSVAILACFLSGVVAVPAVVPSPSRVDADSRRLRAIAGACAAKLVLCDSRVAQSKAELATAAPELMALDWLVTDVPRLPRFRSPPRRQTRPTDPAFLQFTSGSTATPKGVVISHANLIANERALHQIFGHGEDPCCVVTWLPLYHDMGLIGTLLYPLFSGGRCYLMPAISFLKRPERWLAAISRLRSTIVAAPDFAYASCAHETTDAVKSELDLRCLKIAISGGEPVRPETLRGFSRAFQPVGFDPNAFRPCYGLAESTLIVSAADAPRFHRFDRSALANGRVAEVPDGVGGVELVACGTPSAESELLIVDPTLHKACDRDVVGEIWLRGPSVGRGYYAAEQATHETFGARLVGGEGPYLRTGDLGFVFDGQLFVTGRVKDLIISGGRNHHPEDIERSVERTAPEIRRPAAAFSVDVDGAERLVVVVELRAGAARAVTDVREAICAIVLREHGLAVHQVVFIRRGAIPRTTSGKVRRGVCRDLFLSGRLEPGKELSS